MPYPTRKAALAKSRLALNACFLYVLPNQQNEWVFIMAWLVWVGAAISLIGLVGLVTSIVKVNKARKSGLSDEELRAAVQKVMPLNLGSLFMSVIGLMVVMVGISFS